MKRILAAGVLGVVVLAAGCAGPRRGAMPPPGSMTVATVRHTSAPQPAAEWIGRGGLPAPAAVSDAERALLLEVTLAEGVVREVETAPLELANLIVRIESRSRRETVVAVQNGTGTALAYELYLSPDGERFRRVPTCAVGAQATAYERWPEHATWLAVGAVRAAGPDDACR
jgi:hypothetical protein